MIISNRNVTAVLLAFATCISISTCTAFATTISVTNASFESPALAPGTAGAPTGWTIAIAANGDAREFRPASNPLYSNQSGDQLGFVLTRNSTGSMGALFQDVSIVAAGTYRLTIAVAAQPIVSPVAAPFQVNFEAVNGGAVTTLLGGNSFPRSTFSTTSLTDIVATAIVPAGSPNLGRTLRIVLVDNTPDAGTSPQDPRGTYNFDNVRLELVPEPGSLALLWAAAAAALAVSKRCKLSRIR
jgi:hypothetical protein